MQENMFGGFRDLGFRIQMAWPPNPNTGALVNIHGRQVSDAIPTLFHGNAVEERSSNLVNGFRRERVSLDAKEIEQSASQIGIIANLNLSLNSFDLVSITGVHSILESLSRGDTDGGYGSMFAGVQPSGPPLGRLFDAQTADGISSHVQLSQEIRFEGTHSKNQLGDRGVGIPRRI